MASFLDTQEVVLSSLAFSASSKVCVGSILLSNLGMSLPVFLGCLSPSPVYEFVCLLLTAFSGDFVVSR